MTSDNIRQLFFSFHGRIDRSMHLRLWLVMIPLQFVIIPVALVLQSLIDSPGPRPISIPLFVIISATVAVAAVVYFWALAAIVAKRLHDLDKSAFVLLLVLVSVLVFRAGVAFGESVLYQG
jgi:uncharacterized membrane protein YhaH (DUF805 family)